MKCKYCEEEEALKGHDFCAECAQDDRMNEEKPETFSLGSERKGGNY